MSSISLTNNAAQAVKWVVASIPKGKAHSSLIVFESKGDGTVDIVSNTSPESYGVNVNAVTTSEDDYASGAITASSLTGILKKVKDEEHMSIAINDERVIVSVGNSSVDVENVYGKFYAQYPKVVGSELIHGEAEDMVAPISDAGKLAGKDNNVLLSANGEDFSIVTGSEDMFTKEILPVSVTDKDVFNLSIGGGFASALSKMGKIEGMGLVTIREAEGIAKLVIKVDSESDSENQKEINELWEYIPTSLYSDVDEESPCDEDSDPVILVEKNEFKRAMEPLYGAVSSNSFLEIDTTQPGKTILKASDKRGRAKTTLIECEVQSRVKVTASMDKVYTAVNSLSSGVVIVGTIEDSKGGNWISISKEFDDEVEDESQNTDIITAIAATVVKEDNPAPLSADDINDEINGTGEYAEDVEDEDEGEDEE